MPPNPISYTWHHRRLRQIVVLLCLLAVGMSAASLLYAQETPGDTVVAAALTVTNVAQGKAATQSTTWNNSLATRAVDGKTGGAYWDGSVTHTNGDANPWWQVDLGAAHSIDQVVLWNRTDCCAERLSNFYLFVADTDLTGRTFSNLLNDAAVWRYYYQGAAPVTLPITVGRVGRYVRVQLTSQDYLSLAEVQVMGAVDAAAPKVLTVSINRSSDDAEQEGPSGNNLGPNVVYLDSTDLELTTDADPRGASGQQQIGLRFTGITIPKGATIVNAYITFRSSVADGGNSNSTPTNLTVRGQAADNPGTFTSAKYNISSRPVTTAAVAWSNVPEWATGVDYYTPALTTIVQEVVNRSKWASGNSIVFLITGTGQRTAEAWDSRTAPIPPKLTILYQQQPQQPQEQLVPLKGVAIVEDANINQYVVDRQAARALGKALFWDVAVGSDGQTACASCHFHAGADVRTKNQLSPALLHLAGAPKNQTFDPTRSGNAGGVNYRLQSNDFPFFALADPNNRDSQILFQTDDVMSSLGVYATRFVDTTPGNATDQCQLVMDARFHLGGIATRRVEPRNTPTMINAVFNLRNFWDGRANETFNGVNPFGTRDPNAGIYQVTGAGVAKIQPNLRFASLASQAVGPPLSDFEMSCAQRLWPNVGRRLLTRLALQEQAVAANDSLLGSYRAASGVGLTLTYQQLIDRAFAASYRNNSWQVSLSGVNYKLSEANFSFFFGLAVQLYEATLVSDNAPLDRYLTGSDLAALTAQERNGMAIFTGKGKCTACHSGPQLTNAGTPAIEDFKRGAIVSHMILGDGQAAIYDEGFYNIGVRPTVEDIGVGGLDPFGNPLSFAAQYKAKLQSGQAFVDRFLTVNPCTFEINPCVVPPATVRLAVDGAFKTPTLRNVELTGPYFHNGSRSTLEQVIEFYNRGGDRRGSNTNNTSGFGSNPSNLDADIQPLGLTAQEQADLAAFLKRPLTDDRVRCDQAPFDHPQLRIPNGHVGDNRAVVDDGTGRALNEWFMIPAVGANGLCGTDLSGRRLPFADILANGGLAAALDATGIAGAPLALQEPLNPDTPLLATPELTEVSVESVVLADSQPLLLEAEVAATYIPEEVNSEGEFRQKVFLPLVNR